MKDILLISIGTVATLLLLSHCSHNKRTIIHNMDPNGTSELQMTMRDMDTHFAAIKAQLLRGDSPKEVNIYQHIKTDNPTEAGKTESPMYKVMADTYIKAAETFAKEKNKASYTTVIHTCMGCHQQLCPGPMVRIEKLYLDGE